MTAFLLLALLSAAAPRAEELAPSTTTAPAKAAQPEGPVFGAPLRLRFLVDERGKPRGELGFSVRWDNADIPNLPRHAARLAMDPFRTTQRAAMEALTGADVGIYTLHFRAGAFLPVGLLLSPLSVASEALAPPPLPGLVDAQRAAAKPPADPRRRLSLTPARDEIERSLKRDLRRSLINAGFDLAVPVDHKIPFAQKQAVYESLRRAEEVLGED